jgi:CRP/FNR family transcriptional regulator, cyclic AMP receptor protein
MYVRAWVGPRPVASLNNATIAREISRFIAVRLACVSSVVANASPLARSPRAGDRFLAYIAGSRGEMPVAVKSPRQATTNGHRVDLVQYDREFSRLCSSQAGRELELGLPAAVRRLERGPWRPESHEPSGDHLGFMVLAGFLGRRVLVPDRGRSLELLGKGDIFRPWQEDSPSFSEVAWTVIEPATIAALDGDFKARARRVPELLELLAERALRRSRRLAVSAAIANTVGVEERLLLLLWQLAELWGRKTPTGAQIPFRLSHQTLADLVGARRPTVTLALRSLTERGAVRRGESGQWILIGGPP